MTTQPYLILRRARLDAVDAAIVRCVATSALSPSYRELMMLIGGNSTANIARRIGLSNQQPRLRSLIAEGWLHTVPGLARSITMGRRFAGLDDGWPLEIVGAWQAPAPAPKVARPTKWERGAF